MLSQLSRLIGLEGRPQANWICRGLINSGKVLPPPTPSPSLSQPNIHAERPPLYPPLLPLNPPVFRTPLRNPGWPHRGRRVCVFVCETDSVGHPQILIKYHLTCPTSKSHHTWSDLAGLRLAGGRRALVVNCHFSTHHSFFLKNNPKSH